ncbi:MAG: hypothetical protein SGI84_14340 [Gemmatimonadota bacterium]|nr:hypothetical protein [Gemmatimonadota bacterium]
MKLSAAALRRAHDRLLFACAYPMNRDEWEGANRELGELAVRAQALSRTSRGAALQNSGIAGTPIVASFSLALTRWLVDRFGENVSLDSSDADPEHLMATLTPLLDPIEREVLSEHPLRWTQWRRQFLGPQRAQHLRRLLTLLERLPGTSPERDAVFASLRVFVRWVVPIDAPVLSTGRFPAGAPRFHPRGLVKRALPARAWAEGKPARLRLDAAERRDLVDLARGTMTSLLSETDPFTCAHEGEVELHDMGHGVSVALFASIPEHKLALEAYVGYLLLKNHVPVGYGGGWVLGRQARFGLNVLTPFRGGESALFLCQLLRLYARRFGLKLFLVDPYQIGLGNPDGIRSGAFWFYWRLGFRPRQAELLALARAEALRIKPGGKRTPAATLRRLSHAVMAWETPLEAGWAPIDVEQVGAVVSRHILERFDVDRVKAGRSAKRRLGLRDSRLAVMLDALTPSGGWSAAELSRLNRLMPGKDRNEMDHARALQGCRQLMGRLADASGDTQ